MIIKDGRREVHDLGPRITLQPSLLTPIAGSSGGLDGTGGWSRRKGVPLPKKEPTGKLPYNKRAYDNAHRAANREHYLELEGVRRERYRKSRAERIVDE